MTRVLGILFLTFEINEVRTELYEWKFMSAPSLFRVGWLDSAQNSRKSGHTFEEGCSACVDNS